MRALVVQELLASGMADAVVREEDDQGIVEQPFGLQPLDDSAYMPVGDPHAVQIGCPIGQQERIARVVGRQDDIGRIRGAAQLLDDVLREVGVGFRGVASQLAAVQLDLHEERLPRLAPGPIVAVVHLRIPIEVVIRLAQADPRHRAAAEVETRQTAADARPVPGPLKQLGDGPHAFGQLDAMRSTPAAVVMGADRGLVHAGDQGRSKRRADGRRGISSSETKSLGRQPVERGCCDRGLSVTREVRRHVLDHKPQDVWAVLRG